MKHTLKDLDQFFDAARNESPIVDDKDFAALLDQADAAPAGTTEVMSQSPTSQFGSWVRMAINHHGGMIMTGLGLTAVTGLLLTGVYLSSPDEAKQRVSSTAPVAATEIQEQQTIAPELSQSPVKGVAQPATVKNLPSHRIVNARIEYSMETPKPPFRDTSLWANVKIEQVKPLEVTEKEKEALGITTENDGRVVVLHQTGSKNLILRTAFPIDQGVKVTDKVEGTVATISPTMVTDANGKKLAFFFKMDSSGLNFSMTSFSSMQREDSEDGGFSQLPQLRIGNQGVNGLKIEVDGEATVEVQEVDENGQKRSRMENRPMMKWQHSELPPGIEPGMAFTLAIDSVDGMDSLDFANGFDFDYNLEDLEDLQSLEDYNFDFSEHFPPNFNFNYDFKDLEDFKFDFKFEYDSLHNQLNSLDSSNGMRKHAIMIQINGDSMRSEFFDRSNELRFLKLNSDSMRKAMKEQSEEVREQAKKMREQAKEMRQQALRIRVNADSIRRNAMQHLKHLKHLNHDSLLQNGLRMMEMNKRIVINHDSSGAFDWSTLPKPVIVADFRKQREMIDKLVPVQILAENQGLKYNKNGLIFWYMPDEKFNAIAPESAREMTEMTEVTSNDRPSEKLAVATRSGVIADPLVYPNPISGPATFKYTLDEPRAVSIAIHDLLGKQVMRVTDSELKAAGTFEKELNVSSLEAGVYLLVMVTDRGEQVTQRIVIER